MGARWYTKPFSPNASIGPAPSTSDLHKKTFAIDAIPGKRYLLHNRTPCRIEVANEHGEVVLPPLAQRVVSGCRLAPFCDDLALLRQRHQLRVREYQAPQRGLRVATTAVWLAVTVLVVIVVHEVLEEGTLERRAVGISAAVTAALILVVLVAAAFAERNRRRGETVADTEEGDIDFGAGGAFYDGNETIRRTKHVITLLTVITIGAVLPAIAIFVATDARHFLVMHGGLHVVEGTESRLVGRLIQVTYTAVLSLFPAILYFQFDRHRVGTIRSEWVRSIFRMDKRMNTLADVNARYGDALGEASSYSTDSVRLLGGRNSPIVIATLLISLGWTLLVVQTQSFDFAGSAQVTALVATAGEAADRATAAADAVEDGLLAPDVAASTANAARDQAVAASQEAEDVADGSLGGDGGPSVDAATAPGDESVEEAAASATAAAADAAAAGSRIEQPFFQIIVPTPSAAAMAFLGAYFFGAYLILRSYFRGDLRPKIYSQISARLITVVILAYLIQTLFSELENQYVWALSFLAGVVPTTVLRRIGQLISSIGTGRTSTARDERSWLGRAFTDAFATPRTLTQLDGVDLYDSTRLETEGITDIPSLAKADPVSVMISTRLPVERLVDWMDQAVLILLLDGDSNEDLDTRVLRLRRIGIRTASGVLDASTGKLGAQLRVAADRIISTPMHHPRDGDGNERNAAVPAAESGHEAGGGDVTMGAAPDLHTTTVRNGTSTDHVAGGAILTLDRPRTRTANGHAAPAAVSIPAVGDATSLESLAAEIEREPAMRGILQWYASKKRESGPCPTIP